jgi:hypothetical protein
MLDENQNVNIYEIAVYPNKKLRSTAELRLKKKSVRPDQNQKSLNEVLF